MSRIEHCTSATAQLESPAPAGYRWITVLAADACEDCNAGRLIGQDHIECCAAELRRDEDCPRY